MKEVPRNQTHHVCAFDVHLAKDLPRLLHMINPAVPSEEESAMHKAPDCSLLFVQDHLPLDKGYGHEIACHVSTQEAELIARVVELFSELSC